MKFTTRCPRSIMSMASPTKLAILGDEEGVYYQKGWEGIWGGRTVVGVYGERARVCL
jgi:hypothetical protein